MSLAQAHLEPREYVSPMAFTGQKLRSTFIGLALASAAEGAMALEPLIDPSEFPITRRAVCTYNKMPVKTAAEYGACEAYIAERKADAARKSQNPYETTEERLAAVDAACLARHEKRHISFYHACQSDLRKQYKIAGSKESNTQYAQASPAPQPTKKPESSAVGSCVRGAAIAGGTLLLVHGGALILDFVGCAGACTATVSAWTLPSATAGAAIGCATGVVTHGVGEP